VKKNALKPLIKSLMVRKNLLEITFVAIARIGDQKKKNVATRLRLNIGTMLCVLAVQESNKNVEYVVKIYPKVKLDQNYYTNFNFLLL